jgi:hypothetical protein
VKSLGFVLLFFCAGSLLAQQQQQSTDTPPQTGTPTDTMTNPVSLVQPLEGGHNFFNFYLFADGVYDINSFQTSGGGNVGGWGVDVGGGVNGFHEFATGTVALSYRGGYRDYQTSLFPSGTDQNLSFQFKKSLTRRWAIIYSQSAGVYLYGGTYFALQPTQTNFVQTNPFASESRFLAGSISLVHQQSRRLSYSIEGDYFLNRYNLPGAIGNTGVSGSASASYRYSRRMTFSGTFTHSDMFYQRGAGTAQIDTAYVTLSRDLPSRWHLGISGGFSRVNAYGTAVIPVPIAIQNQILTAYFVGHYNTVAFLPYYQGTLSHTGHWSQFSITGGESATPGNGLYLASRTLGVSGFYSYPLFSRTTNLGFGGSYYRLSSVSNTVSGSYSTSTFSASLGHNFSRHIGANLRYDFIDYGVFGGFTGRTDNRFSFGVVFNSRNVPITLF